MTVINDSRPERVLIALDIAKHCHDALISWPNGRTKALRIPNTLEGYQQLLESARTDASCLNVAFESTADYHRNIAYWLYVQGAQCLLISSLACARAREMLFKSWDKHDCKDARVILYLMQQGLVQPFHDPLVSNMMDIQELSNTYHQISLARSRVLSQLGKSLPNVVFPGDLALPEHITC